MSVTPMNVHTDPIAWGDVRYVELEDAERYAEERVQEALDEVKRRADDLPAELGNRAHLEQRKAAAA